MDRGDDFASPCRNNRIGVIYFNRNDGEIFLIGKVRLASTGNIANSKQVLIFIVSFKISVNFWS